MDTEARFKIHETESTRVFVKTNLRSDNFVRAFELATETNDLKMLGFLKKSPTKKRKQMLGTTTVDTEHKLDHAVMRGHR